MNKANEFVNPIKENTPGAERQKLIERFSTVRIADRIFVLDDGRIIEQGTHKKLMELAGKYKKLFTLQAEAYLSS